MSNISGGSASIRPTALAPRRPMCGSRWAWIISARRRCAARDTAAAAKPSKWRCMSTKRASSPRVSTLPDTGPPRYNLAARGPEKKSDTMTYCCGILVRDGLVMIADTRTNAGLDNVSTFRKLHVYTEPGERIMALASSGNLSLSQTVRSLLAEGVDNPETGERETLLNSPTMFQAAQRIGRAIRTIHTTDEQALEAADVKFDLSLLFGGQIRGERPRMFMVYSAGNFIECTTDTPYLQIGEHKYGKPVLDRAVTYE